MTADPRSIPELLQQCVAATPETVKKYLANKHTVVVEHGAGVAAHYPDEAYAEAGAQLGDSAQCLAADIVLKVRPPQAQERPLSTAVSTGRCNRLPKSLGRCFVA